MEILIIIAATLFIITLGITFWFLLVIHHSLKEIEHSLDRLETSLMVLTYQLTIITYLSIKNTPEFPLILERYPDLEERVLEAIVKLGEKQLMAPTLEGK